MPNVKTRTGRWVHRARRTWHQEALFRHQSTGRMSANVVCNRVPYWHAFEITNEAVTCPGCLARRW